MQAKDGSMVSINEKQFHTLLGHGNRNLCRVGDVFKIRQCCFEVETISEHGVSAKGITKPEYAKLKKKRMP